MKKETLIKSAEDAHKILDYLLMTKDKDGNKLFIDPDTKTGFLSSGMEVWGDKTTSTANRRMVIMKNAEAVSYTHLTLPTKA